MEKQHRFASVLPAVPGAIFEYENKLYHFIKGWEYEDARGPFDTREQAVGSLNTYCDEHGDSWLP